MRRKKDDNRMISYLKQYMKGKYGLLIITIISLLMISVFNILKVYFMQEIVNSLENNQSKEISGLFFLLLFSAGLGMIASYFETYAIKKFAIDVINKIRKNLFQKVLYSNEETIKSKHSGKVISLFTNELLQIENFLSDKLHHIFYYPIIFTAGFIYMLLINVKLAVVSVIVIPPLLAISKRISKRLQEYSKNGYEALEKANAAAQDYIQGVDTVKAFNLENSILQKYKSYTSDFWEWQKKSHKISSILLPFIILTYEFPIVVCVMYGGVLCLKTNEINAGGLIAFVQLLGYIIQPLSNLPDLIANYMKTKGAVMRISELEHLGCEVKGIAKKGEDPIVGFINIVEFKNVSFSYENDVKILDHVSFEIPFHSIVGLVGPSGGGKSTILGLILGFYMNYEGSIKVLGKEVKDWDLDELRNHISASLRDDYLFSDTIYNNIRLANVEATEAEMKTVVNAANAYDFIMHSEQQFNTLIGSGGIQLSGGEMQRMSFARALIKKSKLLILDEPTSALDKESEAKIRESIYDSVNEQTVFLVTHRLNMIEEADIIYVLADSHIVEKGTHQELLESKQLYSKLYKEQLERAVDKIYE